jgi:hypothetical protein
MMLVVATVIACVTQPVPAPTPDPKPHNWVDHLQEMNAGIDEVPEDQRMAPLVGDIAQRITGIRSAEAERLGFSEYDDVPEDHWLRDWPDVERLADAPPRYVELLYEDADLVALAREAGSREELGWMWAMGPDGTSLIDVLLPYLGQIRRCAQLLNLDARIAAEGNDGARAVDDIVAIAGLSSTLRDHDSTTISQLVGIAIYTLASRETRQILREYPDLWSDAQLARVYTALTTEFRSDLRMERRIYEDIVQRVYPPEADGRLTDEGLRFLLLVSGADRDDLAGDPKATKLYLDMMRAMFDSTRGMTAQYCGEVHDEFQRLISLPVIAEDDWERMNSITEYVRIAPRNDLVAGMFSPNFELVVDSFTQAKTHRDGSRVAIAAHRYRLAHGEFPNTIHDLLPRYLHEAPLDRFTGDLMIYRLTDDGPLIYVRGCDRDDDGGRSPKDTERDTAGVRTFQQLSGRLPADGDWILFPPR